MDLNSLLDSDQQAVISLEDVHFVRGTHEILAGVTLEIRRGEHWALLGPNGAGKSTILSMCGALQHPSSGSVGVLGHRLGRVDLQALRKMIGHVDPRQNVDPALSVLEVVLSGLTGTASLPRRFTPTANHLNRATQLLAEVGMLERDDARWSTMSQGERGRILIARALIATPALLLLDEPTTGLDIAGREQLLGAIDEISTTEATTTVVVTHYLEELPRSTTRVALVKGGRVRVAGPIETVLNSANISDAFEYPIEVGRVNGRWYAKGVPPEHDAQHPSAGHGSQPPHARLAVEL